MDERSQSSVDSQEVATIAPEPTTEERKILFAAGLKLLQTNSTPISFENLSKIEYSYIEKCKAMVTMYQTLQCACHNEKHPNLKGLLSHLRALRIWFPVFTCYHCMITFTDRSSSTRHYLKCPHKNLETLVKMSNLKKRSDVKTRLYQNYKCTICDFMYWFHEDFCVHIDEQHSDIMMPHRCNCGRVFNSLEDYKDHAYVSCLVDFYCDICFKTFKTLESFQKHAAQEHDNSEGFILLQDDNYRKRKAVTPSPPQPTRTVIKREQTNPGNIVIGKRRSSYKPPVIEPELEEEVEKKKISKHERIPGLICPICCREYSSNNNMWRHYKSHLQQDNQDESIDNSLYCCPDCGGMFSTDEWEKHKEMHKKKSCKECGKIFQFQSELDQHRSVHLNLKVYRDSKTHAYKTTMVTNNDNNIVVMCEICDKMFTSKEQLKEHKLIHEMPVLESSAIIDVKKEPPQPVKKYKCIPCKKVYTNYGLMYAHNKEKHPEKKLPGSNSNYPKKCKYCDKILYTGGSYWNHLTMHERVNNQKEGNNTQKPPILSIEKEKKTQDSESESYHTCKRCFKVFSTKSNLRGHMKCHGINLSPTNKNQKKTTKKVWCDICHCAFENVTHLERHKREDHGDNDDGMPMLTDEKVDLKTPFVYTCDTCVKTFTTKSGLRKHKMKHEREFRPVIKAKQNLVYCKYCKIAFETVQRLSNHMKEEHLELMPKHKQKDNASSKPYSCNICKKTFTTSSAMYGHRGWHKRNNSTKGSNSNSPLPPIVIKKEPGEGESELPKFKCKTCNAGFLNDTALQIHILEKHRNVNTFVLAARCHLCSLDFASHEEYENHKQYHNVSDKQKPNKQQAQQQAKKGFTCNHCTATFTRVDNLRTHVKNFHKEQTPQEFRCSQCDRVFDKQNSLSIHLKVHEKQKMNTVVSKPPLFSCSICNIGFDLPKDLRTHTINAHPF